MKISRGGRLFIGHDAIKQRLVITVFCLSGFWQKFDFAFVDDFKGKKTVQMVCRFFVVLINVGRLTNHRAREWRGFVA
ncbi:hypothetical protein [Pseudomonas caspiana]|uniref:hypothetical protein n=1 Tax=Pseudomonas caspiana TaxID=1451454 RepID=UPI0032EEF47E